MKNLELFNETVRILVNAYQKGELQYSDCAMCAVGNIISARNPELGYEELQAWGYVIDLGSAIVRDGLFPEGRRQIKSTGYSAQNIADIERAFYIGTTPDISSFLSLEDRNFNGLMLVVDCLMQIHEASQVEVKEAKSLFVKVC